MKRRCLPQPDGYLRHETTPARPFRLGFTAFGLTAALSLAALPAVAGEPAKPAAAAPKTSTPKPAETKAGDAKAAVAKPADAKPADAKAADTKPADAKPADAKPPSPPPPAADPAKEASAKYEEGVKAQKAGQHDKAREALSASFKLKETPETALVLAKSEMALSKPRDAAEHLGWYLRAAQSAKPEDKQAAEKLFAEAKTKVGSLVINVDADGAEVLVDNVVVGVTPLKAPIFLDAGSRNIEARKEGATAINKPMDIAAGSEGTLDLSLKKVEPLPPPPPPPLPPPPPPAGPNRTILLAGLGVTGGLALVSLGTAIGSKVVDSSSYDTWKSNQCVRANALCVSDFNDSQSLKATLGNAAIGTLIGAVVVGGGTAAYYFLGRTAPPPTEPSVSFTVTPSGVLVNGSF